MKNLKTIGVGLILIFSLIFSGCTNHRKEVEKYKIAAIFPLTGSAAELGEYSKNGLILGIDEINKNNGINNILIESEISDSKSEMKEGVAIANLMFSEKNKPNVIFSQISGIGIAISEITKQYPLIHFSMSATPKFYSSSLFNIRNYLSSEAISKKAFEFIQNSKFEYVTIVCMESDYSRPIADSLATYLQNSETNHQMITFSPDLLDAKNLSLKIISKGNSKNQLIFLTGYGSILGNISKELNAQQFIGTLLVEPTFNIPTNMQFLEKINYPVKLIDIDFDPNSPKSKKQKEFSDKYKSRFGNSPKLSGALVYETLFLWKYAVENTKTTNPDTIVNFFQSQNSIDGVIFNDLSVKNRNINFPLTLKDLN